MTADQGALFKWLTGYVHVCHVCVYLCMCAWLMSVCAVACRSSRIARAQPVPLLFGALQWVGFDLETSTPQTVSCCGPKGGYTHPECDFMCCVHAY
jgi:hypothetical protein